MTNFGRFINRADSGNDLIAGFKSLKGYTSLTDTLSNSQIIPRLFGS